MLHLPPSLVLMICGRGIPMVLDTFYSNFFIHIPLKINTHLVTNFLTPEGEVVINVFLYINRSACLVIMHDK